MRLSVCGSARLCTCVHCSWFCLFAYCIHSCGGEIESERARGIAFSSLGTVALVHYQRATTITHHRCMPIPRNNTPS